MLPSGAFDVQGAAAADDLVDASAPVGLDEAVVHGTDIRRYQEADIVADDLVARQAPEVFRRTVEQHHPVEAIDGHHAVDGLFQCLDEDFREIAVEHGIRP